MTCTWRLLQNPSSYQWPYATTKHPKKFRSLIQCLAESSQAKVNVSIFQKYKSKPPRCVLVSTNELQIASLRQAVEQRHEYFVSKEPLNQTPLMNPRTPSDKLPNILPISSEIRKSMSNESVGKPDVSTNSSYHETRTQNLQKTATHLLIKGTSTLNLGYSPSRSTSSMMPLSAKTYKPTSTPKGHKPKCPCMIKKSMTFQDAPAGRNTLFFLQDNPVKLFIFDNERKKLKETGVTFNRGSINIFNYDYMECMVYVGLLHNGLTILSLCLDGSKKKMLSLSREQYNVLSGFTIDVEKRQLFFIFPHYIQTISLDKAQPLKRLVRIKHLNLKEIYAEGFLCSPLKLFWAAVESTNPAITTSIYTFDRKTKKIETLKKIESNELCRQFEIDSENRVLVSVDDKIMELNSNTGQLKKIMKCSKMGKVAILGEYLVLHCGDVFMKVISSSKKAHRVFRMPRRLRCRMYRA